MGLTERESEVLRIIQGKRDSEIASLIGAAKRTTERHTQNIPTKLRVETRTAAALVAVERTRNFA